MRRGGDFMREGDRGGRPVSGPRIQDPQHRPRNKNLRMTTHTEVFSLKYQRFLPIKNRATQPQPVWAPMTGPMVPMTISLTP